MNVVSFPEPDSATQSLVGGKGANLGLLSQTGFEVPPGLTVTTEAYQDVLAFTGRTEQLRSHVDRLVYDDADGLESRTMEIRQLIEATEFPTALGDEVAAAYRALGADSFVAVRSSGTAEDTAEASYAGLHDTYLAVRGVGGLIDAVRRCWASLWTARATGYRQRNGFDHFDAPIAVVVQRMVPADVAGVLFTGNPLTTATDEMVVNASWGLGEAVVGGIVTPDEFTLNADTVHREVAGAEHQRVHLVGGG